MDVAARSPSFFFVLLLGLAAFAAAPADAQCLNRRTGVDSCANVIYDACSCGATNAGADPCNWASDGFCDAFLCQSAGFTFNEAPTDCPVAVCGDGVCDFNLGEDSTTCPTDCPVPVCGDGLCDFGESNASCPADCPLAVCGDGICDSGEDITCPSDCAVTGLGGVTSRTCSPVANGPPKSFSDASGAGAGVEVCGGTNCKTSQLSISVLDKNCVPLAGVNVNWQVVSGGGTIVKNGNGKTDSFGVASATWNAGTVAGPLVFKASAGGVSNSPEQFTVFALAGPATAAAVTGLPTPVIAGVPQTFTVTMRDAFGNIATGYEGTVRSTSSDAQALLPPLTTFSFFDGGVRAFDRALVLNTPGTQTLTIRDVGTPALSATTNVTVQRRTLSSSSGDGQSGVVAAPLSAPLSVRYVQTDTGTPIANAVVTFAAPAGGSVGATTVTTNAQGVASTTATLGTVAGVQRFTATVDGLLVTFNATAIAGPATALRLTSTAPSSTAGEAVDLTLLARDTFGNVATTYTGTVAFSSTDASATLPSSVTFTPADAGTKTLAAGATLRLAGRSTISATDTASSALTSSTSLDVFAAAPSSLVAVGGAAQVGLAGEPLPLPLVARLQDAFGNAIAGALATFEVVDGGGSVATPTATTDENGLVGSEVALGNVAGAPQLFRASVAGLAASFAATGIAGPASTLVLFGVPGSAQAGVAHTPRVEARDRHGNLAVDHRATLVFTATDAAATLPPAASFAGAAGVLEFPAGLVLRTAGTRVVSVTDGALSASAGVAVAAADAAAIVVVDGAGQSAVVATALPAPFVVRVVDAFDNPIVGRELVWTAAAGSITTTSITDDAGRAEARATLGTVAGPCDFRVSTNLLEATLSATARAGDAVSFVVTAPSSTFTEDRTAIVVEARDAFGNVAAGYAGAVTLTTTDAAATVPASVAFDAAAAGHVVVDVVFNTTGTHTVAVTDGALQGTSASIAVAEHPPVPSVLLPVAGDAQRAVAGVAYATPLQLVVKDSRGRIVPGAEVGFAVVDGNASVAPANAFADDTGTVRATVTAGTRAGAELVRASLAASPDVTAAFALTSIPGPVASVTATLPSSSVQDCTPASLVLVARDAYGNVAVEPVDVAIDVAAIDGSPTIVSTSLAGAGSGGAATTGALVGTAQVQVQLDAAAAAFINWSVPSLGLSGSEPVTFVAGPISAAASRIVASADIAHGGGEDVVVTLTLVDECGAPVDAGVTAAAGYGTVSDVVAVDTGVYEASFHLGASECHDDPAEISFYVDGTYLDVPFALATVCPEPTGPRITTVPRAAAIVGVPYIVDADRSFEADGGLVRWLKVAGPDNFRVDPVTGFVGWVPARAGAETITVAANNAAGHDELTYTVRVNATPDAPPTASVDVSPQTAPVGTVVRGDASNSAPGGGGPILSTTWSFGDGSPAVTGVEQTHVYEQPGSHVVRTEVIDESGVSAEAATVVTSTSAGGAVPPIARILSTPIEQGEGRLVTELSCDCRAGSAPIAAVQWDFGDGTVADANVVTQVFGPGGWTVRLTVLDDNGLLANDSIVVNVAGRGNFAPLVTAGAQPTSGEAPLLVSFTGRYGDLDGVVDEGDVHWDFGDGGSSNERNPTYTFHEPGIYRVALTVIDDAGLSTTGTLDIEVTSGALAAPRILSVPTTTARAREPYAYDADGRAAARGSHPLTWALGKHVGDTVVGAPAGMAVDPFTGAVTFTPSDDQVGRQHVVLVAWNDAGATSQEWDIDIVANDDGAEGEGEAPPPGFDGVDDVVDDAAVATGCGCDAGAGRAGDAAPFALAVAGFALLRRRRRA